jgi:hypothetical protein
MGAKRNPMKNRMLIVLSTDTFAFLVISFCFMVFSIYLLYSLVAANHRWNFSDPFANNAAAINKKGVVGNNGIATPINPIPKKAKPKATHIPFIIRLIFFPCFPLVSTI